jgi:hypothetical protein
VAAKRKITPTHVLFILYYLADKSGNSSGTAKSKIKVRKSVTNVIVTAVKANASETPGK